MTGEEVAAREGQSPRDTLLMDLLLFYVCVCVMTNWLHHTVMEVSAFNCRTLSWVRSYHKAKAKYSPSPTHVVWQT